MKVSNIANRLKETMAEKGLRQVDIVAKCNELSTDIKIGRNDLSQYVSGKVEPSVKKLALLSIALGVNEAWLLGYDVPKDNLDFYYDILEKATSIIENGGYKVENSNNDYLIYNNNNKLIKVTSDSEILNKYGLLLKSNIDITSELLINSLSDIETIAAHKDNLDEDWTDEELEEIENFKNYILSKRTKKD